MMILHFQPHLYLSSSSSSSNPPSSPSFSFRSPKPACIRCSISQVHSYGTMDYEKRPFFKWRSVYKKIAFKESECPDPPSSMLNQWESNTGHSLNKWELCRIIRELRKYGRFKHALEVYEWMNNQPERFRLSTSDAAIQLGLIGKVHGIPKAEEFFDRLPDNLKDKRIYGSLHHAYVDAKMREPAESVMEQMRKKGFCNHSLPYNLMMSLYMKFNDYDKVESLVSEMIEKNVRLDIFTYNIWLSCRGAQGSVERMEQVFQRVKEDSTVYPNWTSFSTMASMYIDMGELEKAEDCLKKIETRITGRDRMPYYHLITLYGKLGKKDEVYRLWNIYKSLFESIPNTGYIALLASLMKAGDNEGAEKMYEEWVAGKTHYDARVPNLLINMHVREGNVEKAESLWRRVVEEGGQPHPRAYEILAEGHILKGNTEQALAYLREAYSIVGSSGWRIKPVNMGAFSRLCDETGDLESLEMLKELVRQSGSLEDEEYAINMGFTEGNEIQQSMEQNEGDESESDEFEF